MVSTWFEREIREQPEVLAGLLADGRALTDEIAARIRAYGPHSVVIAARGASANAGRYAQYAFGVRNRLSVALANPSLYTVYHQPPDLSGTLVIGISQSGQSTDIVTVVDEARRQGALTLAVTNDPASPMAAAADLCFPLLAGVERAVAATKTYSSELLAIAILSAALGVDGDDWDALSAVPDALAATIEANEGLTERTARYTYARHFDVIGRGYNYATACEVALKLKETSYVVAEPFSAADFQHGPIAVIEAGFPVVLVAPSGAAFGDVAQLIARLTELGAEIVTITDRVDAVPESSLILPLAAGLPEWLSPIVAVVPGQLLALAQAELRGYDADRPRGLTKVTHTR
ncbi:MAG TPA: SIS domain-containing protein [Thermomicrobiales bacterium]|nr:SIS domain-containing protein [Thermomicrobiales bacterium]